MPVVDKRTGFTEHGDGEAADILKSPVLQPAGTRAGGLAHRSPTGWRRKEPATSRRSLSAVWYSFLSQSRGANLQRDRSDRDLRCEGG